MFRKTLLWLLSLWIAFVFVQSLFFKFSNAPTTQHIFGTISEWMAGNSLASLSGLFATYGGYTIGTCELLAAILLIIPGTTRILGALLALGLMTGGVFFHLFTPLGVSVLGDGGVLFYMACSVWLSSLLIIYLGLRHGVPA